MSIKDQSVNNLLLLPSISFFFSFGLVGLISQFMSACFFFWRIKNNIVGIPRASENTSHLEIRSYSWKSTVIPGNPQLFLEIHSYQKFSHFKARGWSDYRHARFATSRNLILFFVFDFPIHSNLFSSKPLQSLTEV